MNKWSTASKARFDTLHLDLQVLCTYVLSRFDCSVLCGHRTSAEQTEAFNSGASKVKFPHSKHNRYPSVAVDLAPYFPGEDTYDRTNCMMFSAYVLGIADALRRQGAMKNRVRCGNGLGTDQRNQRTNFDWDSVHFELVVD